MQASKRLYLRACASTYNNWKLGISVSARAISHFRGLQGNQLADFTVAKFSYFHLLTQTDLYYHLTRTGAV